MHAGPEQHNFNIVLHINRADSCIVACVTSSSGKSAASKHWDFILFFSRASSEARFQVDTMTIGDGSKANATEAPLQSEQNSNSKPKNFKRDKRRVGDALGGCPSVRK